MVIWRDFSQKPMHCLGIVREWPGATLRLPIDCPCHRSAGFSVGSQRWISKGQERLEQLMFFCCKGMTKNDYYSVISISIIDYAQQTIMKASLVCLNHHEKQKHRLYIYNYMFFLNFYLFDSCFAQNVRDERQLLRLFWTGEVMRCNLWFGIEFEAENTRSLKN